MRAVVAGGPAAGPTLVDTVEPLVGPGDIRVKVHSASLNGFDLALAAGYLVDVLPHGYPVTLGRDFAGIVDQLGEGVRDFALGDEVFGVVPVQPLHAGSFAEFLVLSQLHQAALVPPGLDLATAGVLGLAGSAAYAMLAVLAPVGGRTLLVSGATGGVGAFAVQLAVAAGATVIATASPGRETDHVRALGAHHAVDRTELTTAVPRLAPGGVDMALHLAGDAAQLAGLVAPDGRLASLLLPGPDSCAARSVTGPGLTTWAVAADPRRAVLDDIAAAVADGRLRVPVQRVYGLTEVPRAFADFATGTLGKLAVRVR